MLVTPTMRIENFVTYIDQLDDEKNDKYYWSRKNAFDNVTKDCVTQETLSNDAKIIKLTKLTNSYKEIGFCKMEIRSIIITEW